MSRFDDLWDAAPLPLEEPLATVTPIRAASRYAAQALADEAAKVAAATEGVRNDTLNQAAFNLGQLVAAGHLDERDVRAQLDAAAHRAGLGDTEIGKTMRSGLEAGMKQPRIIPDHAGTPPVTVIDTETGERRIATPEERVSALLAQAVETERIRREARRLLDAEEAARDFREPPSRFNLTEELQIPDEPVTYRIDGLLPVGGNVLLTAQFKTGKTTLIDHLAKAIADRQPFLGRFDITPPDGRVALFNYEVDDRQYRAWLRDVGISNTDAVAVLNLRGFRLPVQATHVEDWVVQWLTERDVRVWVVDPFARAFTGAGSENDNAEVGRFLDTLDVIKRRAGVEELILPTHTGRAEFEEGAERARGATRLDDWCDIRWFLTKDDEDVRYFRATGRDVEVAEEKLTFDPDTRALSMGGGDRRWEKMQRLEDAVVTVVEASPGVGVAKLRDGVRQIVKGRNDDIDAAAHRAASAHRIRIEPGKSGKICHLPAGLTVLREDS